MSYPLPKFLVTTVAPKNLGGTPYEFDYKSKQMTEYDLPVFLLDVKYNGNLDKDKGDGTFSGTAVSQKEFTEALHRWSSVRGRIWSSTSTVTRYHRRP